MSRPRAETLLSDLGNHTWVNKTIRRLIETRGDNSGKKNALGKTLLEALIAGRLSGVTIGSRLMTGKSKNGLKTQRFSSNEQLHGVYKRVHTEMDDAFVNKHCP